MSAPAARPVPPKLAEPPKQRPQQPRTVSIDAPPARPNKLIKKSQQKQKAQALSGVLQNLADVSKTKKADKNQKAKQKQKARDNLANTLAQAAAEKTQRAGAERSRAWPVRSGQASRPYLTMLVTAYRCQGC